jgi:hypothetical protein
MQNNEYKRRLDAARLEKDGEELIDLPPEYIADDPRLQYSRSSDEALGRAALAAKLSGDYPAA